jgi:hypothetical protein
LTGHRRRVKVRAFDAKVKAAEDGYFMSSLRPFSGESTRKRTFVYYTSAIIIVNDHLRGSFVQLRRHIKLISASIFFIDSSPAL